MYQLTYVKLAYTNIYITVRARGTGGNRPSKSKILDKIRIFWAVTEIIWAKPEFFWQRQGIIWVKSNFLGTDNAVLAQDRVPKSRESKLLEKYI